MPEPEIPPQTHYQLLGVKPTASAQQIRRAYRDLSKAYHPDTTHLPEAEATAKFQRLNEAYATLSSPERRWVYDQQMGYSRISVLRPAADLNVPAAVKRREYKSNAYLDPTDRPLSAGEIFALFILGVTFVACLVLVVTISLTQGDAVLATAAPENSPAAEIPAVSAPSQRPPIKIRTYSPPLPSPESPHPEAAAPSSPILSDPATSIAPTLIAPTLPSPPADEPPGSPASLPRFRADPSKWL